MSNLNENNFRHLGPSVRVCVINVEGISRSKSDYLSKLANESHIDIIMTQETHTSSMEALNSRGKIGGYVLVGAELHEKYGTAVYRSTRTQGVSLLESSSASNISLTTVKVNDLTLVNVYKPPNIPWPSTVMKTNQHPAVYCGDFNSHSTEWGYQMNDHQGEQIMDWSSNNDLKLIFDPKEKGTFHSARWNQDYNPDLCFVSANEEGIPLMVTRSVLNTFPHSQHRPVLLEIGLKIPLLKTVQRPRWNFRKAKWSQYQSELDDLIGLIPPVAANYERFAHLTISIAKKHIPRGFRKEYVPCWGEETDRLYREFKDSGNQQTADDLLKSLDNARRERWCETVENLTFARSSRKPWSLIRKLGAAKPPNPNNAKIHPNKVARRIVRMSKVPPDVRFSRKTIRKYRELRKRTPKTSHHSRPFTTDEVDSALSATKIGKAAGFDCIYPEFLVKSGPRVRKWMARFFSDVMLNNKLPLLFKKTKIIALLKPGKSPDQPENYRPVALLSVMLKLLERLLYNRWYPLIDEVVPQDQAGFRSGRSCTDQVLALTNFIESGFQRRLKTGVVFVDLTAAYDTVWKKGLLYKLLKVIPDLTICDLLCNILSDRIFQVFLNDKSSSFKKLNNGLAQGSVLAPLLFNLYTHDLPPSVSRRFMYADDIAYACQSKEIDQLNNMLSSDMLLLTEYTRNWRLKPSISKTESSLFHLNNLQAMAELRVQFEGEELRHNDNPKYLGVFLDRTLTYKSHLQKLRAKVSTRNNLIRKLAGTSWGANAHCLRISSLSLVYSTAEYCSPVWLNSAHAKLINTELNTTMRVISGTLKSTPVDWLPVLCDITPPPIRRKTALLREFVKATSNPDIPLFTDLQQQPRKRLKSRKPPLALADELFSSNWQPEDTFTINSPLFDRNANRATELQLPRKAWCNLNRLRTGHGRSNAMMKKWGFIEDSVCVCGFPDQTVAHILHSCPILSYGGPIDDIKNLTAEAMTWLSTLNL